MKAEDLNNANKRIGEKLKLKVLNLIFTILLAASSLYGAKITLTIDKNIIGLGERTVLHIKTSGFSISNPPEVKGLENFNYQFIGTSSNISIINGKISSEKEFNFLISPKKIGTFTIGPAIAEYKGRKIISNVIKIQVKKTKFQQTFGKYISVKVSANKTKVKVGEEVILTLKIYRKIDVTNLNLSVPEFKKVILEKLEKAKTYPEIINGQQYLVTEIKYSLFPLVPGKLIINPFILTGEVIQDNFDAFFKNPFNFQIPFSKTFRVASNLLKIEVQPLNQDVFAVGDYIVKMDIDKTKAKVGDTINLSIDIKGKGNLQLSSNLKLPKVKGLKYYYDKPVIKIFKRNDGIYSEKIEKYAIVPEKKGKFIIPEINLKFFNPESNKIEILKIPEIVLNIYGNSTEKLEIVEKHSINQSKENNISPIFTEFPLENQTVELNYFNILIILIPAILIILITHIILYLRQKRIENREFYLSKGAFKKYKNCVKEVSNIEDFSKCLKKYFNEKFFYKKEGITFEEIIEFLENKYSEESISELKILFSEIEEKLYFNKEKINIKDLIEKSIKILKGFESER